MLTVGLRSGGVGEEGDGEGGEWEAEGEVERRGAQKGRGGRDDVAM